MTQVGMHWSSQDQGIDFQDQGMTLQTLNKLPTLLKNKDANKTGQKAWFMCITTSESLVYVHYNLRLLSHYCDVAGNVFSKRDATWDNNPEENNLQYGAMVLEHLEAEILGDHDGNHILGGDMPPPSISRVSDASILPLSS
jgi:hypothetical protein